eukprot:TRINITY_DN4875_c0_g1_i2.p1 TRINITY_DN4875_c0_g1~~TRINITY_DN4875_c0_g1_i2.p1  ORF type:complete len:200 (-),score=49.69 TRINITY_DN4875_c0_g1_i2:62-661(-)
MACKTALATLVAGACSVAVVLLALLAWEAALLITSIVGVATGSASRVASVCPTEEPPGITGGHFWLLLLLLCIVHGFSLFTFCIVNASAVIEVRLPSPPRLLIPSKEMRLGGNTTLGLTLSFVTLVAEIWLMAEWLMLSEACSTEFRSLYKALWVGCLLHVVDLFLRPVALFFVICGSATTAAATVSLLDSADFSLNYV